MKKFMILAGICLVMCANAIGQDSNQRQGGQRARRMMDAVVDTAIINHMDINTEVLQKVYALQQSKQEEQRKIMGDFRQQRGQRLSDEERKAMAEKREAFTAQYRKELRALIGDETYIAYLEKQLSRQGMMRMMQGGGQRGNNGQFGGQRQGGGQRGGFGGGFGGGDDF